MKEITKFYIKIKGRKILFNTFFKLHLIADKEFQKLFIKRLKE